ncbi:MAG TPA: DUF2271 domain-containing protein, partial [Vicinamibacterales bacterium]|nr:DUF2271 domain-containing protein [Vicinamibacterales bacterium]
EGVILNIGGDIVTAGRPADIRVTSPDRCYENDAPLTTVRAANLAIASSGSYERPGHLLDPRTGDAALGALSATVIAQDCVTANALATALCVMAIPEGLALVEQTAGAEAIVVARDGRIERTSGFRAFEQATSTKPVASGWPLGSEMRIELTLTGSAGSMRGRGGRGGSKAPYVAIWAEDARGKYVRTLAVWAEPGRYINELIDWWGIARNDRTLSTTATRATRPAGQYRVAWNGLDDDGDPVPQGTYKINVEVSREHGTYARKSAAITCAGSPASVTLPETAEFAPIVISYGPRS